MSSNKDGLRWAWLEFETLKAYIKECEENTWYGLGPINTCTEIISFKFQTHRFFQATAFNNQNPEKDKRSAIFLSMFFLILSSSCTRAKANADY